MAGRLITDLHHNKIGKVSDKWDSYLGYYDSLFGALQDAPIAMLEIGVQNGGSLETWTRFFTAGKIFIGCDINPACGALQYTDPRVNVIIGDANSLPAYRSICSLSSEFDIVIDDGSHVSTDILNSFVNYFPLVKPGGLYVVEDTHTLYESAYGGGILNEFSAYAFFKKLVDVVNFQFWQKELAINTYLRSFFPLDQTPGFIGEGWIESIEFRNSIITIKKSLHPGHDKLGSRVIVGTVAQVHQF